MHAVVSKLRRHVRMIQRQLSRHVVHIHIVYMGADVVVVASAVRIARLALAQYLGLLCEVAPHALVEGLHHIRVLVVREISAQPKI